MKSFVFRVVFLLVFGAIVLTAQPQPKTQIALKEILNANNITVQVGYKLSNGTFKILYSSYISLDRLEVFYVAHELDPAKREICSRITFRQDSFNRNVDLEALYNTTNQRNVDVLGNYINSSNYLVRGHFAAMADYGAAIDQLCTFYYINTAPQWQSFNNANWKSLEYRVRQHFYKPRYDIVIYTGTIGVLELGNRKVYLDNGKKIKVPLFFYKVVYDKLSMRGTAIIGINNPFFNNATEAAYLAYQLCTDRCRNTLAFNWLTWQPDVVRKGYSFCCTVDDFRSNVPRLPSFQTNGLLY